MAEESKEKRIEEEYSRLSTLFRAADTNRIAVLDPLFRNCAFMRVTLDDLQKVINEEGVIDHYQNGQNQYGQKQSAALQSYNSLTKSYAALNKTLRAYLPSADQVPVYEVMQYQKYKKEAEEYEAELKTIRGKLNAIREKYNIDDVEYESIEVKWYHAWSWCHVSGIPSVVTDYSE